MHAPRGCCGLLVSLEHAHVFPQVQPGRGMGGTWRRNAEALAHSDRVCSSRRGWFPFSYTRVLDGDGGDRLHMR